MNEHADHVEQFGIGAEPVEEPTERYVEEVLGYLPPAVPGLHRVRADLTAHLREAAEASGSPEEAVREMGAARETARGYAEGLDLQPASLVDRTGAFLLDVGLAVPPSTVLFLFMARLGAGGSPILASPFPVLAAAIVGLLALLYFPFLEHTWGQTLGKRLFGLTVSREDGLRVGWVAAVVRRLPLFFEVFWLDALFAPFTEKRQRAFDIVAGTIVVPGIQSGGKTVGWVLVVLLWAAPPSALWFLWRSAVALPF